MKKCSKCKENMPFDNFYKDKRTPTGLKAQCKNCHIEGAMRTRCVENSRRINKEYLRRAIQKSPNKFRARWRNYSRDKDEKYHARVKLNVAVRDGHIQKPDVCQCCGKNDRITAHHWDYSKPLEVDWLCYGCHAKLHRKIEIERVGEPLNGAALLCDMRQLRVHGG